MQTMAKRTGVKATGDEMIKLNRATAEAEMFETKVDGNGVSAVEATQVWAEVRALIDATARAHGLPRIAGTYGIDFDTSEFLAPA